MNLQGWPATLEITDTTLSEIWGKTSHGNEDISLASYDTLLCTHHIQCISNMLTKCEHRGVGQLNGHPCGSGNSEYHSSPQGLQNPAEALLMSLLQTAGIWLCQPGQMSARLARTTGSARRRNRRGTLIRWKKTSRLPCYLPNNFIIRIFKASSNMFGSIGSS